ncbi:hypothetical protein SAMN04515618_11772 [Collimonas sp. OK307]|uniref:hypothetical protein n=1 Tax=Collimonas sp. OK307 TaxID=1801620 RepID=UPI0008E999D9|nr:hypothetical protein [Collimonas sp. OK307]SFI32481.1 hypothetical protein SAMN04515618_11772 [Collimonas sp. OK307]
MNWNISASLFSAVLGVAPAKVLALPCITAAMLIVAYLLLRAIRFGLIGNPDGFATKKIMY